MKKIAASAVGLVALVTACTTSIPRETTYYNTQDIQQLRSEAFYEGITSEGLEAYLGTTSEGPLYLRLDTTQDKSIYSLAFQRQVEEGRVTEMRSTSGLTEKLSTNPIWNSTLIKELSIHSFYTDQGIATPLEVVQSLLTGGEYLKTGEDTQVVGLDVFKPLN